MFHQSRRSVLHTTALGFGVLCAGCAGSSVDERVDTQPPGSPGLPSAGEWPSYRFDHGNTGANPDGDGVRDGEEYWRLDAGGPATVANGTLYNTRARGDGPKTLTYRDPATAAVTTRRSLVEYGVNPPPIVAGGRVFVTTFIEAFCFDAASGEQRWRGPEMDGVGGPPTVAEGYVLVTTGGFDGVDPHLRAFDAATGDPVWRYDTGGESDATPAVGDGRVFVTSTEGLHAVDLDSGTEAFVVSDAATDAGSPAVADGTVYAVRDAEAATELVAVAADDGTVRWRTTVERGDAGVDRVPVVADGTVYALTKDGLAALDTQDGSVRATASEAALPAGRVGDVLYAVSRGVVFAFDAESLDSLWSLRTEDVQVQDTVGRVVYHVTPVDGAVYVSARDAFHGVGPARE